MQPAARAGPILRVAIAAGKFHGVTSTQMPTGCWRTTILLAPDGAVITEPERADRLLGVPPEELGGVRRLAAGVGERLAVLQRDQVRDLVGPLGHQLERPAQDLGALRAARSRPSPRLRRRPPRRRPSRPRRCRWRRWRCTSPVAGSSTSKRPPSEAGTCLPPMYRSSGRSAIWSSEKSAMVGAFRAAGSVRVGDEELLGREEREDLGPSSVMTISSSIRAAETPSEAGQ